MSGTFTFAICIQGRRSMTREMLMTLTILLAGTNVLLRDSTASTSLGPIPGTGRRSARKDSRASNLPCKVYPGTSHTYWVYVPAIRSLSRPA